MNLIVEGFNDITTFLDTIKNRNVNKAFKHRMDHLASNIGDYSFTFTNSYAEADELAKYGYKEGLDKLMALDMKINHREKTSKPMPNVDFVGYAAHVANAIAGIPKSMISATKTEQKAKVITILYYMGDSAYVDADKFVVAGKNLLNVINTLEIKGYRVALYILEIACIYDEYALCSTNIKDWKQPSNPLKMSYPLVHPSFSRRHSFRWLETHPNITDERFSNGYGKPLYYYINELEGRKKFLKENNILKPNWFYVEFRTASENEADKLIEIMGIV